MEHYVTLFDSLFLPQGLALHRSMQRHLGAHTLWVLCMDAATHTVLDQLQLPQVRLLALEAVETEALRQVRPTRNRGEYCWTMTPFSPQFVFAADPSVQRVTYLDADLWFRNDPAPIFREFTASGKEVLITDHAYAPEYDQSALSGQYCVQFMTFTRSGGEAVRQWWAQRCLEWCYARWEAGKFGDQKYLDDWPERFAAQVHVLQDPELILAPWNATRFPYGRSKVWHFHGLRLFKALGRVKATSGAYEIPAVTKAYIYQPYLADLQAAVQTLAAAGCPIRSQVGAKDGLALTLALLLGWGRKLIFSAKYYPRLRYPAFDLGRWPHPR